MGVDADLDNILREVVQFLESLCDIDLPLKIENARENLLHRSKTKLSTLASCRASASPEPYLDMNAGKGLLLFSNRKEIEIEEYVGVEEQTADSHPSRPDYYESFQEIGRTITGKNNKTAGTTETTMTKKFDRDEEAEKELMEIYKTFTPAMTMNKAQKFGPLDQKVERKSFGFVRGNIRPCWIGLVGSHLLIYTSEKDKQPPEICSIRGYTGRPSSKVILKDQDHAKSAFEIFCPGNKTLQFTARTPKEMEEWLVAISRTSLIVQDRDSGMYERSMDEKIDADLSDHNEPPEERYQDVEGLLPASKREEIVVPSRASSIFDIGNEKKITRSNSEKKIVSPNVFTISPPALPIRLPRRLPSLPNEETPTPSYEALADGYDEDDIYHKIEDFQDNRRSYENVKKKSGKRGKVKKVWKKKEDKNKKKTSEIGDREIEETDNERSIEPIEHSKKDEADKKQRISILRESISKISDVPETYDDVRTIVPDKRISGIDDSLTRVKDLRENFEFANEKKNIRCSFATYDDVVQPLAIFTTDSNTQTEFFDRERTDEVAATIATKSPTKSPHKRSFLDRVRNRKDSPKKDDKKKTENAMAIVKKTVKKEKKKTSLDLTSENLKKPNEPEMTMYDDVSGYPNDVNSQNLSHEETTIVSEVHDFDNYNYPPPPRPIYDEPPNAGLTVVYANNEDAAIEDVYDDVGNYHRDNFDTGCTTEINEIGRNFETNRSETKSDKLKKDGKSKNIIKNEEEIVEKSADGFKARISATIEDKIDDRAMMETEHYQIPRTEPLQANKSSTTDSQQQEQLYDDIAILAEFRSRTRNPSSSFNHDNSIFSSINSVDKLTITIKKPWNRFSSGKKINSRDVQMKNHFCNDIDEPNDHNVEKIDPTKSNKLKKLINKMETTLGKQTPTKSVNSLSNKMENCE